MPCQRTRVRFEIEFAPGAVDRGEGDGGVHDGEQPNEQR